MPNPVAVNVSTLASRHPGADRDHTGLQGQQIRIAACQQGHLGNLVAADHLAHLRAGGVHVDDAAVDGDRLGDLSHLQRDIDGQGGVDGQGQAGLAIAIKPTLANVHFIVTDRQGLKRVESLCIRRDRPPYASLSVESDDFRCRDEGAR